MDARQTATLTALLAQAQIDLTAAQILRQRFNEQADTYKALAAEQTDPSAQARYMNASIQQRGQAIGALREAHGLLALVADLERRLNAPKVVLTDDQCAAVDETMGALA